jgi:hypothetical protein
LPAGTRKEHEIVKPFAFYGRVSTEDQQDPASSRAWQLRRALELIEPNGSAIVAEFFDIGQSRSLPWKRRPEASRLLELLRSPDRGFEAVAISEPQRAFYGAQFALTSRCSSTTGSSCGSPRSAVESIPAQRPTTWS